jgi:hypothetical protein
VTAAQLQEFLAHNIATTTSPTQLLHTTPHGPYPHNCRAMVGFVTAFPDCCKIDCFCLEWGLKDCPDFGSDWWCEGSCFCCFENCGMKELMETQICCLGPCSKPELKTTFSFPVLLSTLLLLLMRSLSTGHARHQFLLPQIRLQGLPQSLH